MHGDEIRGRKDVLQVFNQLDLQFLGPRLGHVGVVGDDLHAEGLGPLGHLATDAPHAEDAERLLEKFLPLEGLAIPLAVLHGHVGLGDLPGQGHEHGKCEFRRGNRVSARRVHHDNAALRGGVDINVVHAHAGAPDDLELLGGVHDPRRDPGLRTHDDGRGVRRQFDQLIFGWTGVQHDDVELRTLLKQLDALGGHRIANQYFHG